MAERDLDALFGLSAPSKPAAPTARPVQRDIPLKPSSVPTEAQKIVASQMGNPNAQPAASSPEVSGERDIDALFSGSKDVAPAAAQTPWYERGKMPPTNDLTTGDKGAAGLATMASNVQTFTPPKVMNMSAPLRETNTALQNEQNVQSAAKTAQQQTQENYQAQLAEAQAKQRQIEQEHKIATERHRKAMLEHAHAQTLTPEEMFEQRQKATQQQTRLPAPASEAPLNRLPVGGSGTFEYAQKFGATPSQAMDVPSMSHMQKVNIPQIQKGFERASGLSGASGINMYEGVPLALPEKAAREYLQPKHEANISIEQRNAQEDADRRKIAQDLLKHKAGAKHALDLAEIDLKDAKERLKEAQKQSASNKAPTTSAAEARETARQQNIIQELEAKRNALQEQIGRKAPRIAGSGFDEYSNTFPMGSAADLGYAKQLLQGIASPNLDERSKLLFKQELNKLQNKNPKLLPAIQQYYGR